jgi:hypothetical protein
MGLGQDKRLVFIGGLHRSGTSILHRCLSDHPAVSAFHETGVPEDEGQHLQSVYPTAAALGGAGTFAFDRRSFMDEDSPLISPENSARLMEQWLRYWDPTRDVFLEKSPPNLVRTRFLQALFPESRFVIVTRHPIAVAYATQKWTTRLPALRRLGVPDVRMPKLWVHELLEHWLIAHGRFDQDRAHLRHVHLLRYEDFVKEPHEQLDRIWEFLDLPPQSLTLEVKQGVNDCYWQKWTSRRESQLTARYTAWVTRSFESRLNAFGYSLLNA